MGCLSSKVEIAAHGLSGKSTLHAGCRRAQIPIPEQLEDWQRLEEPLLHKTLHFMDKAHIKGMPTLSKSYNNEEHHEAATKHRDKHEFNVVKLMKKNGMKQYAHLFKGMSPGDAGRFAKNGLTFDKRKELKMKGEHYHQILKILHVENAPPKQHKNKKGHLGVDELSELLKIVGVAEKVNHSPLPPEDLKRIAIFLWTFRDILRDESYKMIREIKFDQSIFISTKLIGDYPDKVLNGMFHLFEKVDIYHNGQVVHQDLSDYFEHDNEMYASSVFVDCICHDYGSADKPGYLDVKEFCTLVETICLMHEDELLHFTFHELQYHQPPDPNDPKPYINVDTICDRLKAFDHAQRHHEDDAGHGGNVNYDLLKEMRHFLKQKEKGSRGQGGYSSMLDKGRLYFEDWLRLTHDSPMVYYGAQWMQEELRKKSGMGVKYWSKRRRELTKEFDVNAAHEKIVQDRLDFAREHEPIGYHNHARRGYRKEDKSHIKRHGKSHGPKKGRYKHKGK